MKLITPFHSESNAHSSNSNISFYKKILKIGEIVLRKFWWNLVFHQNFAIFAICPKHWTIDISRLTILSWTEWYKHFHRSLCSCWDILCNWSTCAFMSSNPSVWFWSAWPISGEYIWKSINLILLLLLLFLLLVHRFMFVVGISYQCSTLNSNWPLLLLDRTVSHCW